MPRRLIPAHAGKTGWMLTACLRPRAHPRSRGENRMQARSAISSAGSSPLTRGKPHARRIIQNARRLIPAHAGKTELHCLGEAVARAHPRSRGENAQGQDLKLRHLGSSPLTRGKPRVDNRQVPPRGLIPAHAGKTRTRPCRGCRSRAHPRSRGENPSPSKRSALVQGSSPLTRGKLARVGAIMRVRGLIPAHAGKTCLAGLVGAHAEAHPRSRGENP